MSAPRRVTTRAAVERELAAAPELVKRLEKLGLLAPVARAKKHKVLYYDVSVRSFLDRALRLQSAGYAEKDIALVLGRSLTKGAKPVDVVGLDRLATVARLRPERVVAWVERGLVMPWALDDDGAPLFARESLRRVRGLAALETVGLGDLAADWVGGRLDAAQVKARIGAIVAAGRLLVRLVAKKPRAG